MAQDLPILAFEDAHQLEQWLTHNAETSPGIWLKLAKKGTGIPSVNYSEAVDSALCFGWIDSQAAKFDDRFYLQKLTPRRPKSKWSKVNCEKAEALIAEGRMQPAGLRQVQAAKADGRWEAAYDSPVNITVPADFQAALDANPPAAEFFQTLNRINRYAILHRIQISGKPESRQRQIQKLVEMLARGEKIYP